MKNKKGFTLIEILAVIVVLAVILAIAAGIILNVVEKTRRKAAEASVIGYVDAVEFKVAQSKLYEGKSYKGLYEAKEKVVTDNVNTIDVDIKGTLPKEGSTLTLREDGKVNDGVFYIDKYKIAYNGETKETTTTDTPNEEIPKSIEEQLKEINNKITELEKENQSLKNNSISIDDIYPVGSVYISTTDDTVEKVEERFGGKWEKYSVGRTLVGEGTDDDGNILQVGQTGGSSSISLDASNIPSHSHTYTPVGTIKSTFTGTAVNTGSTGSGYSIGYGAATRTTSSAGAHTHGGTYMRSVGSEFSLWTPGGAFNGVQWSGMDSAGAHTHTYPDYYANSISGVQAHTHTVTAAGKVTSTFTGTKKSTGASGSGTSFSVQDPYIVTYMYKRIK